MIAGGGQQTQEGTAFAEVGFRVDLVGHATLRIRSGGRTLVTDPWLGDAISGLAHFPPLVHEVDEVAAGADALYISHVHPDHFHPATLERFSRDVPVYIGAYRRKGFRDAIARLGFDVVEVPFQQPFAVDGTDLEVAILEHDGAESAAYDSSLVVRAPDFTLFENNDCPLAPAKYAWVRRQFDVDYAFLGYSPASFFPIAFELEPGEKERLLREAAEQRYAAFVEAAEILSPRIAIPFASGLRFLDEDSLWKNVAFNSAAEAARRLRERGRRAEVMNPGDCLLDDGSLRRRSPALEREAELTAIAEYARLRPRARAGHVPTSVQPDLIRRFRDHVLGLRRATRQLLPAVGDNVIAYVVAGAGEDRFYFDFSRPDAEVFQWGEPARYDMRYTYTACGLQRALDGDIDWDELHFTAASVHQVRYARDFYVMLRSETLDLG